MISFPNCKINLGLWVTERRPDGYHNIQTIMYPIPWCDVLEIVPSKHLETTFSVTGLPIDGPLERNLCYRAWRLLSEHYDIPPVVMHLHKVVPSGAGLGGGSADAAFTLRMLNNMFVLDISNKELRAMSQMLGMDCPFFIENIPTFTSGRGEILKPLTLNLDGFHMIIVKPPLEVSTVDAYSGIKPVYRKDSIEELIGHSNYQWKNMMFNDFENGVFERYPEIKTIKDTMYEHGAVYASMSGSGSAVFGLFDKKPKDLTFPGHVVFETLLGSHS